MSKLIALCNAVIIDRTASHQLKSLARRTLADTPEEKMKNCSHDDNWKLTQVAGEGRFCTACGYHDWSYDD